MSNNTAPHVAYNEGIEAAEQGKEVWENPYTTSKGSGRTWPTCERSHSTNSTSRNSQ